MEFYPTEGQGTADNPVISEQAIFYHLLETISLKEAPPLQGLIYR